MRFLRLLGRPNIQAIIEKIVTHYVAIGAIVLISTLTSLFTLSISSSSGKIISVRDLEKMHYVDRVMRATVKHCGWDSYVSWIRIEKQYPTALSKFFYKALKLDSSQLLYTGTFQSVVGFISESDITDVRYLNDIYQDSWIFDEGFVKDIVQVGEGEVVKLTYEEAKKRGYFAVAELMSRTIKKLDVVYATPIYFDRDIIWIFSLSFVASEKATCPDKEDEIRQIARVAKKKILDS